MSDIISCTYDYTVSQEYNSMAGSLCILQPISGQGILIANGSTYSLVAGSLYYINCDVDYKIQAISQNYRQNKVVFSQDFMDKLSVMLEFNDEVKKIFYENSITFVPLINYKSIVSRFKHICNYMAKNEPYSKARIVSEIIALFNYAVYSIYH